ETPEGEETKKDGDADHEASKRKRSPKKDDSSKDGAASRYAPSSAEPSAATTTLHLPGDDTRRTYDSAPTTGRTDMGDDEFGHSTNRDLTADWAYVQRASKAMRP